MSRNSFISRRVRTGTEAADAAAANGIDEADVDGCMSNGDVTVRLPFWAAFGLSSVRSITSAPHTMGAGPLASGAMPLHGRKDNVIVCSNHL